MNKLLSAILTIAFVAGVGTAQAADRDVVEAFYSKLLSGTTSPDLATRMDAVLAPDWQSIGGYEGPVKTRDQFLAELKGIGSVAPNLSWKVEEILHDGDRYIVRGHATATPVGPFLGVTPSGHGFDIMSIDIHTVKNHKIIKSYHVEDWQSALHQLQ